MTIDDLKTQVNEICLEAPCEYGYNFQELLDAVKRSQWALTIALREMVEDGELEKIKKPGTNRTRYYRVLRTQKRAA